jgi:murein DD-endopeptidase MepM/ murein hydrolase activator NlpD
MNVVIFGKGFGKPRQVSLSGKSVAAIVSLCSLAIFITAAVGGYYFSVFTGSGVSVSRVASINSELQGQRKAIATTRQQTEDTLDALAIRIGQMNARVIRLDALGRRLTEMAELNDGEFDFDSEPAMGGPGPDEPTETGSAVAVPEVLIAMNGFESQLENREAQLTVLESVLMNQNLNDRVYPAGRPVKSGWMSSYFGRRTDPFTGKPATHRGVDFAGKEGAEVIAVADGVVTWSASRYGYGELVEINHGNGYSTRYAHNSANLVEVGEVVRKGQTVALMGDTGRATGPNLHFEVLLKGQRVNPVKFIRQGAE